MTSEVVQNQSDQEKLEAWRTTMAAVYGVCDDSFHSFVEQCWNIIEPGKKFLSNFHLRSLSKHLEAVYRGDITKLLVFMPPRSSKSTFINICFQPWVWTKAPATRFLNLTNSADLAISLAITSKKIMDSQWYQNGWGHKWQYSQALNTKEVFENNMSGRRTSLGMTSKLAGKGGDIIIIDDPHDALKASNSPAERKAVIDAYRLGVVTRLNDANSKLILIMQRLHPEDLAGFILENDKEKEWQILEFPMGFDPERRCETILGVQDPRTEEGELLWPERGWDAEWCKRKKSDAELGAWGYEAQMEQRPYPADGGIIKLKDFKTYEKLPENVIETVQFWDTAQKAGASNDFWVCGTWARTETGYYLIDVFRERLDYPDGISMVKFLYERYKPSGVIIEDKSTGQSLLQELSSKTTMPVIPFLPDANKEARMIVENNSIRCGLVYLPKEAAWLHDFFSELTTFPGGKNDDQVDMLSMSIRYFREQTMFGTINVAVI